MASTKRINDQKDAAAVADAYLLMTRCVGGRIVAKGFVCPHCDSNDPSTTCRDQKVIKLEEHNDDPKFYKGWSVRSGSAERTSPGVQLHLQDDGSLLTKKEMSLVGKGSEESESDPSNKMTLAQVRDAVERRKTELVNYRDSLREFIDELHELDNDCDEAYDDLERAADALSRQV